MTKPIPTQDLGVSSPSRRGSGRRGRLLLGSMLVLAVAVVGTTAMIAVRNADGGAAPAPTLPAATATTTVPATGASPRTEVVSRLREIVSIRDKALLDRDASLLDDIYTVDCNCLMDGRTLIRRLLRENVVWKGLSTTLTVRQIQRVNDRLWIVVGLLSTPSVRVENESGELVRVIPPERNRLRFALAKPIGFDEWLLGHTSLLKEG
jgi:hypothetical protein